MGETFDPNLHQAVQTVPASEETPADTIVEVLQKGYKLQDRVTTINGHCCTITNVN